MNVRTLDEGREYWLKEIAGLLEDLYFSSESVDWKAFYEENMYRERMNKLRETLIKSEDSSIILAVMAVAAQNAGYAESLRRLAKELDVILSTDSKLRDWASSPEILGALAEFMIDSSIPNNVRIIAERALSVHAIRL